MTKRQNPSFLQTSFAGPVEAVSRGIWKDGWARTAYADIGRYRVRNLLANDQIGSAIEEAAGDPHAVVRIGRYLFWRWALSVTHDGHTERHGIFSFFFHGAITSLLFLFFIALAAVVWGPFGWAAFALWVTHIYMNVTARFGSDIPLTILSEARPEEFAPPAG